MASAVEKSFRVLETLTRAHGSVRLSAIAAELDLQKSTVHRILAELIELGYAARDPDDSGRYRPTLRMWELGTGIAADLPVKQVAGAALHELHERTGETVNLVVRDGDDALYVDKLVSPRPLRFTTRVGSRVPLALPTGGRAILAHSDDAADVVHRIAARVDLARPLDAAATLRAIERVRRQGYAISGSRLPVCSVAAPVVDRRGNPAGALAVSAPAERVDAKRREAIIAEVVATATRLSEGVGRL